MKRALPLLALVALAGCGSSHHARQKPITPVLGELLKRDQTVRFVVHGTVKIDLESILAHLHRLPPVHFTATGSATRFGLRADGSARGPMTGTGTVLVAGEEGYARAEDTWYSLGDVTHAAGLLRRARWKNHLGPDGKPEELHGELHLSTNELEHLSGLSLPFGVDGAELSVTLHLSRWGKPVTVPTGPRGAVPLPR